jgi:hypothetical protein
MVSQRRGAKRSGRPLGRQREALGRPFLPPSGGCTGGAVDLAALAVDLTEPKVLPIRALKGGEEG